jgi:hypothetical protein
LLSWLPRIIRYLAVPSSLLKLLRVLKREEVLMLVVLEQNA